MKTEVVLNGKADPAANYIGWSPRPATVRLSDATGATAPVKVMLRNRSTSTGGQVVFSTSATGSFTDTLRLTLPVDKSPVKFFAAGNAQKPASKNDKDASIEVVVDGTSTVLSQTALMVRVRKNAAGLSTGERDRFIGALAIFNAKGMGKFKDIRAMHVDGRPLEESHGARPPFNRHGFLPWHRAYLLDLERELQVIDASVALHYWRFDEPGPSLFTADFLGEPRSSGSVRFASTNPLKDWISDGTVGFRRVPRFDITKSAGDSNGPVISEVATLAIGTTYNKFVLMEGEPHGHAHTSWDGPVNFPPTAPNDPLFFMLHCNVDRLWAKWQFANKLWNQTAVAAYFFQGSAGTSGATRIGHNRLDTMWPWNGDTKSPRPSSAPSSGSTPGMPPSIIASAPPQKPTVGDMIDYQGHVTAGLWQGFDYDDVMF
jgi:tyrosinase